MEMYKSVLEDKTVHYDKREAGLVPTPLTSKGWGQINVATQKAWMNDVGFKQIRQLNLKQKVTWDMDIVGSHIIHDEGEQRFYRQD